MQDLFAADYDVATARSGMSAIRSMAVSRPDLILLDYEMPVCNGKQVLEMIRSDREFNDTPVMFLTNKVDKESVKRRLRSDPKDICPSRCRPKRLKRSSAFFAQKKSGNAQERSISVLNKSPPRCLWFHDNSAADRFGMRGGLWPLRLLLQNILCWILSPYCHSTGKFY